VRLQRALHVALRATAPSTPPAACSDTRPPGGARRQRRRDEPDGSRDRHPRAPSSGSVSERADGGVKDARRAQRDISASAGAARREAATAADSDAGSAL